MEKDDLNDASLDRKPLPEKKDEYSDSVARKPLGGSNSICESIAHMTNACIGGGIFAMHVAFSKIGASFAMIGLILIATVVGSSMCALVSFAQKMYSRSSGNGTRMSYSDLAEVSVLSLGRQQKAWAKYFRYSVDFILILHLLGSCLVYQVFLARNLKDIVQDTPKDLTTMFSSPVLKIYVMAVMVPCVFIAMVTNLKDLAPFAIVHNFYTIMLTILTIYYGVNSNNTMSVIDTFALKSTLGLFEFIGISLFSIEGITVSLLIGNNMAEPKDFSYVVLGSLPYVCLLMMLIGFFGYWSFGDEAVAPITVHFPWTYFPIMTKVFLGIVIYITYAQVFYYGFEVQWVYLKKLHKTSNCWYWERIYRVANVLMITLAACWLQNACKIMSFVSNTAEFFGFYFGMGFRKLRISFSFNLRKLGCFTVPLLSFLFPAIIQLAMDWAHPTTDPEPLRVRISRFIVVSMFGCIIIVLGTYYNLYDVF